MEIGLGNKISASIGILFSVPCSLLMCQGEAQRITLVRVGVNNTGMLSRVCRLTEVAVANKHRNM